MLIVAMCMVASRRASLSYRVASAVLFEPVGAAFDDVTLSVDLLVEGGRASTGRALCSPAGLLVDLDRDRRGDRAVA
jgi:hypothetical protein